MSKKSSRCLRFLENLSSNSVKGYEQSIKKYEQFHGLNIEALVDEALDEQSKQVPHHQLKIIDRLENFQNSLIDANLTVGTIKLHMTLIQTIYRKNRVEIPYIEPVNVKKCKKREYIEYKDILTKDEIRCALTHMKPPAKARAMAILQGGLSNEECEHLTTRAFIDELQKYHQCDDDFKALEWLSDEDHPVIWVTKLVRVKTGKPYYAILGAEAVNAIASAKIYESQLPKNKGNIPPKLLSMNKASFIRTCRTVNKKCGLGLVAEESKFRSHMLRKFYATYIRGSVLTYEEHSRISNSQIDEMQGRGKTNVQDTYIKSNPLEQKLIYAKVMNNISFYNEYTYEITDVDIIIHKVNQLSENQKLRKEVNDLTRKLKQKEQASEKVNALRKELGEDVFKEMVSEILTGGE